MAAVQYMEKGRTLELLTQHHTNLHHVKFLNIRNFY
jgi:hypothetical protein